MNPYPKHLNDSLRAYGQLDLYFGSAGFQENKLASCWSESGRSCIKRLGDSRFTRTLLGQGSQLKDHARVEAPQTLVILHLFSTVYNKMNDETSSGHAREAVPNLLYHSVNPQLYPTNDPTQSLLAIRFARPVQVSSVRIYPEGVETPSGLGSTCPSRWNGSLYFNESTSDPVNALASTTISYEEGVHAVDYLVQMPEGVTTRLILLQSPAERVSISIYGFDLKQPKIFEEALVVPRVEDDITTEQIEAPIQTIDYIRYERQKLDKRFGVQHGSVDLFEIIDGRSRLMALVDMAEQADVGDAELEWALDLLHSDDPLVQQYLARQLPKLYITSRIRGSSRSLSLPPKHARQIVSTLLVESTNITDGTSIFTAAAALSQPYLGHLDEDDPLRSAFTPSNKVVITQPDTADGRRLARLEIALSSPSSSLVHTTTPAELLSILAPSLLASLSTAPQPPLGIPSQSNPTPESQASAWAGKVYSSHQFRDRQRENLGLGISGPVSRPASRHVDDYSAAE